MSGSVVKETYLAGGNATITGSVGENLKVSTGNLRISPNASVGGDLNYWSSEEANISQEATVAGQTMRHDYPSEIKKVSSKNNSDAVSNGFNAFSKITSLVSTLVLGLLLIKLFPNASQIAINKVKDRPWASLGIGFLFTIITPLVTVILFITVLGIPLAFMIIPLYFIYLFFARLYVILAFGNIIMDKTGKKASLLLSLMVGLLSYYIVSAFPLIGGITKLIVVLMGTGAGYLKFREIYHDARSKKVF